jgi:hypothetical protein
MKRLKIFGGEPGKSGGEMGLGTGGIVEGVKGVVPSGSQPVRKNNRIKTHSPVRDCL